MNTIYLAGGCFWGCQKYFDMIPGVKETQVGYANGPTENPSYEDVKHDSGHAETVRVVYDPGVLSLDALLQKYFLVIGAITIIPIKLANENSHPRSTKNIGFIISVIAIKRKIILQAAISLP